MDTACLGIARINGACAEVITISGIEWNIVATSSGITQVFGASVVIIAGLASVYTTSGVNVTGIISAGISIVAIHVRLHAFSEGVVALVDLAIDGCTSNVEALVTSNGRMVASTIGSSRVACVIGARIKIFATLLSISASSGWDTAGNQTSIGRGTNCRRGLTSKGGITKVVGAIVAIVTHDTVVNATISIDSSGASPLLTFVSIIASSRTHASGST